MIVTLLAWIVEVSVLKESNQVGLDNFLQDSDSGALETQIGLEVLSNLTNQMLEREFADEKLYALLVLSDFFESNGSKTETVGLLDSFNVRSQLASGFGG
ncbi:hypothetical protein RJ641_036644 [Dillenia turbinata]|uniref:Uncharacterized protein n=1 Tax=Dillenia turbinata TaxID=194707 RepID=A0AAN8ZGN6_9MAGN